MGRATELKKVRQAARRHNANVAQEVLKALLSVKKWSLRHRLKFCWWLLLGRGEWKGV